MGKSLNQCNFIGNLGQDPEVKQMPNGGAVANFSIAVSDDYKNKNTGEIVQQTDWVLIVVFGKLAEICGQYLNKGSKVFVSGKQKTRKWQDQNGVDRYTTEIVASEMQMLDGRNGGGSNAPVPQQQQPPQQNGGLPDDFDDDMPF